MLKNSTSAPLLPNGLLGAVLPVKHPATYTNSFIPVFAELLNGCDTVLDIFAGVGKLAMIKEHGFIGKVVCNELEREVIS